jgi:subtilisin family serine protease
MKNRPHTLSHFRRLAMTFFHILISMTALIGCQGQPDFMAPPPAELAPSSDNLDFASQEALELGQVKEASYLVMFRSDNSKQSLFFSSFRDEYQFHYLNLSNEHLADPRVKNIDVLTSVDLSRHESSEWVAEFGSPQGLQLFWNHRSDDDVVGVLSRVDFETDLDAREVLVEWEQAGRIWYAEPNSLSYLSEEDEGIWKQESTAYQNAAVRWHQAIGLIDALKGLADGSIKGPTDADITANPPIIAVLDSGVDYEHPALKDQIWINDQPGAAGCENDIRGCNTTAPAKGTFGNGDVWPVGASGPGETVEGQGVHGTHVSGLVAAKPGSGYGGVCPVCKIMIIKVAEIDTSSGKTTPGITDDSQIRGLKYVTRFKNNGNNAVRIVNSSFGKYSRSRSVAILIDVLKKLGNGTLVIAAASNEDSMIRSYPAALSHAIGVASVDSNKAKSAFSNFGPWVDIAAPGKDLVSTVPGSSQAESSGTSMAAPVVAGSAGLYLAINPSVSFDDLRKRIVDCADPAIYTEDSEGAKYNFDNYFPLIEGEDSRRPLLGSGMVNVLNMLKNTNCRGAIGRPLDRVTAGCSSIGIPRRPRSYGLLVLLVLCPLMLRPLARRMTC